MGFGSYAAFCSFRSAREHSQALKAARVQYRDENQGFDGEPEAEKPKRGRLRSSNCLAIVADGAVRLKNGGYLRGYEVVQAATFYKSEADAERLYDQLAVMLTTALPQGSSFQFRLAIHPDQGDLYFDHKLDLLAAENVHEIARIVKLNDIEHQLKLGARGYFQKSAMTLWVYIPAKHENDNLQNSLTKLFRDFGKKGFGSFKNLKTDEQTIERLINDERECFERAEKSFRQIENVSPLKLRRFSYNETATALYFSHHENAAVAPIIPSSPQTDLRAYLCGESIRANNTWYVLHGNTPVTMISLFVPPESDDGNPGCYGGIMRVLSDNPKLSFRHSIITEYITLDKEKMNKSLDKRLKRLERTSTKPTGEVRFDEQKGRAYAEIKRIKQELTSSGKQIVQMRFYILCYGDPATTRQELEESVERLEKNSDEVISFIRRTMAGADASREEPSAIRALYERTLLGEMTSVPTEREIEEQADSLCAFIPAESTWQGIKNPHSIFPLTTGKLLPLNFFRNDLTSSPLIIVLGEPGSGKTFLMQELIMDVLAKLPFAQVNACDYGESMRPMVEMFGGRHLRFTLDEVRTINIWDYDGLEDGEPPDEAQINLVVEDTLILLRISGESRETKLQDSVLRKCVKEVYDNEIPHNKRGVRRHEPVLSHLVNKLKHRHFDSPESARIADELAELLEDFIGHPWLDAPTHESYRQNSRLDVFELGSLKDFPQDVRRALAFRVGARVSRSIGARINGQRTPKLNVFDEMHEFREGDLSVILKAVEKGARHGRKENAITMLGTHTYADLRDLHGLTSTAGCVIVGKQDDLADLKAHRGWSDAVEHGIKSIHNMKGAFSQFVVSIGKGETQQVEKIQVNASPLVLWAFSSDPVERNARVFVQDQFPHWTTAEVVAWLAERYPNGLSLIGKSMVDRQFIELEKTIQTSNGLAGLPTGRVSENEAERFETVEKQDYRLLPAKTESETGENLSVVPFSDASRDFSEFAANYSLENSSPASGLEKIIEENDEAILAEVVEAEPSQISKEVKEGMMKAFREFFGDDIDDEARLEKGRNLAKQLGVDIPGVIVVEPNEEEIYETQSK